MKLALTLFVFLSFGCLARTAKSDLEIIESTPYKHSNIISAISKVFVAHGHKPLPINNPFECNFKKFVDEHGSVIYIEEPSYEEFFNFLKSHLGEPIVYSSLKLSGTFPASKHGMGIMASYNDGLPSIVIIHPDSLEVIPPIK
jgi:hypothetical protein